MTLILSLCIMSEGWKKNNKALFLVLWLFCIVGSWSILPYVQYSGIIPSSFPFTKVFLLVTLQTALFFGIACWLSYLLVPRAQLFPFSYDRPFKKIIFPGVIAGVIVGITIYLLNITVFNSSLLSDIHPPFWTGLLASVYGAVNEEILLRLFFFTLVFFLLKKIFRFKARNRLYFLWFANVIVAVFFGFAHLPALVKLVNPTSFEVFRIFLLNGIAGIVFGWLYWSKGLWTAMTAHFITDVMIHGLLAWFISENVI